MFDCLRCAVFFSQSFIIYFQFAIDCKFTQNKTCLLHEMMLKKEILVCFLAFLKLSLGYNVDTSVSTTRIIKPFLADPEQSIDNPTYFGYGLNVQGVTNSSSR